MATQAGEMTQTPPGNPQWRAADGRYVYGYNMPVPPQTARPHAGVSTGTTRDYVRRVGGWAGSRGIGGWMVRLPLIATWYVSIADDSGETALVTPPTAQKPPPGTK